MKDFLVKTFGPNWETTLWGGFTTLCMVIAGAPDSVAFLPDGIEGYVKGISALVALVSGATFAAKVKSANVTGGSVPATKEAEKRVDGK